MDTESRGRSGPPNALAVAGVAGLYFLTGKLGLTLAVVHPSATAVWPPSGLAFAAVLLLGYRIWPGVFLGAFAVNLATTGAVLTVFGISCGNTLEALAGAWLVQRFAAGRSAFHTPGNSLRFAGLAGGLGPMIAATIGVGSLILTGYGEAAAFAQIWLTWWLGDATGILLFGPFIVLLSSRWPFQWRVRSLVEGTLAVCSLLLAGFAVLTWAAPENRAYLLELIWTPILFWTAFRMGPLVSSTSAIVLSVLTAGAAFTGVGFFANGSPNAALLLLQTYIASAATMALVVGAAVWERKQVELQLVENDRQLARRNRDLERFAYAAKHDLQEPLRTVSIFTQMMVQEHKNTLGSKADEYMEYIVNGVDRMSAMIQSLSVYSGIASSAEAAVPPVELDEILADAQKNLAATISEAGATVSGSNLPVVPGDRHQLMSLFQIFIHNAIKYRSHASPEISFHARADGDQWVLAVADNGIGIAPEHHGRVFDVFTRLHGGEIPGTGMGLAIAKRIVELHGGTLWVESRLGEGARFCFTIARARARN